MEDKTIYDLKLHEQVNIHAFLFVTRVPGGWLYETVEDAPNSNTTFVPFDNEFWEVK